MIDSVKRLRTVVVRNCSFSIALVVILVFGAIPSHSQDEAADETPAPALSCVSAKADLISELDLASARIAQLETGLAAARTLTDNLSGQVRDAQVIIRKLEKQRDSLEAQLGVFEGGHCPETTVADQCADTASEVDALRAQVKACIAGADPDAVLQARIDELIVQVVSITEERDVLQARIDAARGRTDGGETSEAIVAEQQQVETLTTREGELAADLSEALDTITALTLQRDRAFEDAEAAQTALAEAMSERDATRDELAKAEARMAEMRATAATAIGASSGALTVCENSPVAGGVVLADEPAARAFKAGLGMLGEDVEVLVSPVPSSGFACVLQPILGLLAPASETGKAYVVDYGTLSQEVVDVLPRSTDCEALLETVALQDVMVDAIGFGSAKRAFWVQDAGKPALCGSRNGQVGLLRVEPRNQSAVFFLTAQTF